ncbi:GNAT family N-acetyltransferase [Streptomyces sp. NPDC096136]|uniref:GNAT family N-acetyltransferase n=1 Tax=Streptomyces sp. NPDC096136 TaxID=3366076 RepID=UPI003824352F
MIINGVEMRSPAVDDAAALTEVLIRNRAYMAPYDPWRPEEYYTEAAQRARIEGMLAEQEAGRLAAYLLVEPAGGAVIGAINLGNIVRGPLLSGGVGYWIDQDRQGRGLITAAVEQVCRTARDELGLHRVEAQTLVDNTASMRVLAKAGFTECGLAPRYLHINGAWRDHRLFQRVLHDDPPPAP